MIDALVEKTESLEEQIVELEAEQRRLGDALGAALADFDEDRIAALQQRRAAIPGELLKLKIAYQKAMLELAQARHEADKVRLAEISKMTTPVFEQIKALQEQVAPLVDEANLIASREGQHRDRKNNARNRLERLLAERGDMLAVEQAPVVRSLMHKPR